MFHTGLSGISNVSSITLSDTKAGTISVARSDLTGDLSDANNVTPSLVVLRKITSSYTLNVTGMTVSDALTLKTPAKATTLTVGISDTLDNVMSNLTSLQAAAKVKAISGITLPSTTAGSAKPVLSITAAQLKANPDVLATIKGDYELTITGVAAADALTTAGNADKVLKASGALSAQATIAISDTSANLVKNIATLETLATAGRLTSITVSDGKVISDDKITLPPSSVLDRIRNTNDTNTSMFELLWREPDIANPGANIIKYQIFDIRNNAPQYVIDNTSNTLSYLAGAAGNDTMQGRGAGVNIFSGGAGNDTIAGGTSGQDIVSYTGKSTDYSIKLDPNDVTKIIVSDLRVGSPDGTDTLSGISKLRFSDTVIDCASIK